MGIVKHTIGSLGDIGVEIIKETAQVPKDIAGKALESLGSSGGKQQRKTSAVSSQGGAEQTAVGSFDATKDREGKIVARAALAALAAGPQHKEPTVYEKQQKEREEKKMMEQKRAMEEQGKNLPKIQTKRKRGDLYGMQAKKAGSEVGKNVKAE